MKEYNIVKKSEGNNDDKEVVETNWRVFSTKENGVPIKKVGVITTPGRLANMYEVHKAFRLKFPDEFLPNIRPVNWLELSYYILKDNKIVYLLMIGDG